LEANHQSAGEIAERCTADAELVCPAMEDRDISQDRKIRMQSRGIEITHCGTAGKPDLFLLHSHLADLLDDHD
jgi:hypothetical protein